MNSQNDGGWGLPALRKKKGVTEGLERTKGENLSHGMTEGEPPALEGRRVKEEGRRHPTL